MNNSITESNYEDIALKTTNDLMRKLVLPQSKPVKPIVIMLGGLQGSGKTTLINNIKDEFKLVVISGDIINQRLFDKKYEFSDNFPKAVKAITVSLTKNILEKGHSLVIDSNAHSKRIDQMKELLQDYSTYQLVTIYLKTSPDELRRRVEKRKNIPGIYLGKLDELEDSLAEYGNADMSIYDYVVNTDENNFIEVVKLVRKIIKKFN